MKRFNVNDYVKVKLNNIGKNHLSYWNLKLPQEDENGYSKWQLWNLMNTFSEYMLLGSRLPFDCDLIIEDKYLHDT